MSEQQVLNQIMYFLETIPHISFWRQNNVGVFDARQGCYRKSNSKFSRLGISDIIGVIKGGRILCIEVKSPERYRSGLSSAQKSFLEDINKFGGLAFAACSAKQVEKILIEEGII